MSKFHDSNDEISSAQVGYSALGNIKKDLEHMYIHTGKELNTVEEGVPTGALVGDATGSEEVVTTGETPQESN